MTNDSIDSVIQVNEWSYGYLKPVGIFMGEIFHLLKIFMQFIWIKPPLCVVRDLCDLHLERTFSIMCVYSMVSTH